MSTTCDISGFLQMCDHAEMFFARTASVIATNIITEQILKDSEKGQDAFGRAYAGYAASQIPIRKKLGLPTDRVTLRRMGQPSLLDTIKRRKINEEQWITVREDLMPQAEGLTKGVKRINLPARDFFQYSSETEQRIEKTIENEFKQHITA